MSKILHDRGYLVSAMTRDEQYNAAALAYSIKIKNPDALIALVVPDVSKVYEQFEEPFDYILEFPYQVHDIRRANDWQLYWSTPFKYNIVYDCNILVRENQDYLWDRLTSEHDLAFPVNPVDFKGTPGCVPYYFYDLTITPVNSSVWFFTAENDICLEYFKLCDPLMRFWEEAVDETVGKRYRQKYYISDFIHSIVLSRMWNYEYYITDAFDLVDMQISRDMFDRKIKKSWTDYISFWITDDTRIKIQNFNITSILHYVDSSVMTQEIYEQYRNFYRDIIR